MDEFDGELSDVAWIDDSLETITFAIDRLAITFTIDEFFQMRKDIDTVVKLLQESDEVQLCTYEDGDKITRYMLVRRDDGGEVH
jgi:hypothetical protein